MDNYVYDAFTKYFHAVEQLGYVSDKKVNSLLVLNFFYELMYNDYRGYISKDDYHSIDQALNCLYGTNCLIPYPDYLKMGKLRLGEVTELAQRTKNLEVYDKELDRRISDNDLLIADNIKRIDEYGTRTDDFDAHFAENDRRLSAVETDLHGTGGVDDTLANHESRITTMEGTKVVKGKNLIQTIPDIVFNG